MVWRVANKSCVSDSWNLANDTTHGQTGSTTAADRRPTDQANWLGKWLACYKETVLVEYRLKKPEVVQRASWGILPTILTFRVVQWVCTCVCVCNWWRPLANYTKVVGATSSETFVVAGWALAVVPRRLLFKRLNVLMGALLPVV